MTFRFSASAASTSRCSERTFKVKQIACPLLLAKMSRRANWLAGLLAALQLKIN